MAGQCRAHAAIEHGSEVSLISRRGAGDGEIDARQEFLPPPAWPDPSTHNIRMDSGI